MTSPFSLNAFFELNRQFCTFSQCHQCTNRNRNHIRFAFPIYNIIRPCKCKLPVRCYGFLTNIPSEIKQVCSDGKGNKSDFFISVNEIMEYWDALSKVKEIHEILVCLPKVLIILITDYLFINSGLIEC